MAEFATYSRFHSREEADDILQLLENEGISYKLEVERDVLDKVYIGDSLDPMIAVKIQPDEFERVNALIEKDVKAEIEETDPDYYLFHFSDEELIDVIRKPGEWNQFDQTLAKKILSERGTGIPVINIPKPEEEYKPIRLAPIWIGMEVLISIFFSFAGIIIGLATIAATKTLRNGKKVKIYDQVTHANARLIIIIGIIRTLYYFYVLLK